MLPCGPFWGLDIAGVVGRVDAVLEARVRGARQRREEVPRERCVGGPRPALPARRGGDDDCDDRRRRGGGGCRVVDGREALAAGAALGGGRRLRREGQVMQLWQLCSRPTSCTVRAKHF